MQGHELASFPMPPFFFLPSFKFAVFKKLKKMRQQVCSSMVSQKYNKKYIHCCLQTNQIVTALPRIIEITAKIIEIFIKLYSAYMRISYFFFFLPSGPLSQHLAFNLLTTSYYKDYVTHLKLIWTKILLLGRYKMKCYIYILHKH